jgi:hypothetical protein
MLMNITALFCCLDDFCKIYEEWEHHHLIPTDKKRHRSGKLSLSEMLFIMILFHLDPFKNFKVFYQYGVCHRHRDCFKDVPCYDRFIQIMPRLFMPLTILLHSLSGEETGVYFADSTSLKVCHNKRIHRHKTFDSLAARGKTSMGWFYGFKLHIVINHKGEIVALKITAGNVDDRAVLDTLTQSLKGKVFADKGYIGKNVFQSLWQRGLHLITGIRKNMKNYLMPWLDKCLLRKRFIVETVFDTLKSHMGLEHSRHRSPINALIHILSCLAAYALKPTKPAIKIISNAVTA